MDAQTRYMFQNNPNDPSSRGTPQRPNNSGNGNTPGGNNSSFLIRAIFFLVLVLLGWYLFQYFTSSGNSNTPDTTDIPYSTFIQEVQRDNVNNVLFQGQDVTGAFKTPVLVADTSSTNAKQKSVTNFHFTQLPSGASDPNLTSLLLQHNVKFESK